ncbi:DNA gyrase inhibitor YacG [Altererythrobacter aquiaggeris]|uniref:DNA gyrase inhibitor YacG n=1 Tax=Aestuarierythrobacter aquiaggeris TaxID=1898396 RepID=UPI003019DEDA
MTTDRKSCPICKKVRTREHSPFCSQRCRDRDLAKWFGDGYAVPGRPAAPHEIVPDDDLDRDA